LVQHANDNNVTLFTIGIGNHINKDVLWKLAYETNGKDFYIQSASELGSIYLLIKSKISGTYVLAHTSTDPVPNGTWRTIELTLKYDTVTGNSKGKYLAPYIPPDVSIQKSAVTETPYLSGYKAVPTDTIYYNLTVTNTGPTIAQNVKVVDFPHDSLIFTSFIPSPTLQTSDSLIWLFSEVGIGEVKNIQYQSIVDTIQFYDPVYLQNYATVRCDSDTVLINNFTSDSIYYIPLEPADVNVIKRGIGDSLSVQQGDSTWFVFSADTFEYRITIANNGGMPCEQIEVTDILPSQIQFLSFTHPSYSIIGDTLRWSVNRLEPGGDKEAFVCQCYIDTLRIPNTLPLINWVSISSETDSSQDNNTYIDTLYYVPFTAGNLSISKQSITDTLIVRNGYQYSGVLPGDTIEYYVTVRNQGQMDCNQIQMQDVLPDWVTFIDFSEPSYQLQNQTLSWDLNRLESNGDQRLFTYHCRVDTFMPPWDLTLINTVTGTCPEDTILWDNTAIDTVWAIGVVPPNPEIRISPTVIHPTDSVQVEVVTHMDIQSWDLEIFFEDGSRIYDYADGFIQSNLLTPENWTTVVPDFGDTYMRTTKEEEKVGIILETLDLWNVVRSDTAYFIIKSENEFYLDENTYKPTEHGDLKMRFRLSSNRHADIKIYDIAGEYIKTVADGYYLAGWNYTTWDGRDENGHLMGSGLYMAILSSGNYHQAQKFILIR
jgi:uncharacterized repeat protein (TIGR01451 family)